MGHNFINKKGVEAFLYCETCNAYVFFNCEACNAYIFFNKDNGKYFQIINYGIYTNKILTCEENIIKNIIE